MAKQEIPHNTFSKSEAIRTGWELTKKHFWFFVAVMLITQGISYLFSFISQPLLKNQDTLVVILGIIIMIIGWIISLELGFATIAIFLKVFDKKKTEIKDLFSYFNTGHLFRFLLVGLLSALIVGVGLIFFIIPGIYLGIKYGFAPYIYVDKHTGVWEAFKESARITQGVKWQIFLLCLLQLLITLVGIIALFVGLFFAVPTIYFSDIYVYRKLSEKS